jgi:hypothetical protein
MENLKFHQKLQARLTIPKTLLFSVCTLFIWFPGFPMLVVALPVLYRYSSSRVHVSSYVVQTKEGKADFTGEIENRRDEYFHN